MPYKVCLKHQIQVKKSTKVLTILLLAVPCQKGPKDLNIARIATLLAGLPDSTPAYTLNRFCSSGLQSVSNAADLVKSGSSDLVIAAGVESMSSVPMTGFKPSMNPKILSDENISIAYGMGLTAEKVVQKYGITREAQDQFAYESHQKAIHANNNGLFENEIAPISTVEDSYSVKSNEYIKNTNLVSKDEGPRKDTSLEILAKLRTVFAQDGSVTAGNSSQMSDAAAAVLVASEEAVEKYNLTPKAEFMGFSVAGVPAEIMGIGPVKAVPKVLNSLNLSLDDIGWIELNEAFAAQSLAVIKELNLDPEKVNPLGGAIALGHPLGATGAIRVATLISAMQREKIDYGMVTMCIGTGMGAAGIIKRC